MISVNDSQSKKNDNYYIEMNSTPIKRFSLAICFRNITTVKKIKNKITALRNFVRRENSLKTSYSVHFEHGDRPVCVCNELASPIGSKAKLREGIF